MTLRYSSQLVTFFMILIFLSMLVTNKYIGKGYVSLVFVIGACFAIYSNIKNKTYSHDEETLILFGVTAYLLALSGFFQQHHELTRFAPVMESYLKALLPLALLPMFYFSKIKKVEILAYSIAIASLVAGGAAIFDFFSGFPRGQRLHGSPIIFGDLAMLFGVLSFVFSALFYKKKLFPLFFIAGIVGIASSLFSGSRGGWIVLLTLPLFLLAFLPRKERIWMGIALLSAGLVLVILVSVTENPIKNRLQIGWNEITEIASDNTFSGGSLGARMAMWRVSWQAFISNPFFGIGIGEFYYFKKALIASGDAPVHIESFKHSHSEYMSILSGMGIVGVAFYITFFVWLWRRFYRAIKTNVFELRLLGIAGISTIICYLDFSLSESFLSSHLGAGAFYFLMTFYIYLMSQLKTNVE